MSEKRGGWGVDLNCEARRAGQAGRQAGRHSGREGRREEGGMGRKGGRWGGGGDNIKRNARGALAQKKSKAEFQSLLLNLFIVVGCRGSRFI